MCSQPACARGCCTPGRLFIRVSVCTCPSVCMRSSAHAHFGCGCTSARPACASCTQNPRGNWEIVRVCARTGVYPSVCLDRGVRGGVPTSSWVRFRPKTPRSQAGARALPSPELASRGEMMIYDLCPGFRFVICSLPNDSPLPSFCFMIYFFSKPLPSGELWGHIGAPLGAAGVAVRRLGREALPAGRWKALLFLNKWESLSA